MTYIYKCSTIILCIVVCENHCCHVGVREITVVLWVCMENYCCPVGVYSQNNASVRCVGQTVVHSTADLDSKTASLLHARGQSISKCGSG